MAAICGLMVCSWFCCLDLRGVDSEAGGFGLGCLLRPCVRMQESGPFSASSAKLVE